MSFFMNPALTCDYYKIAHPWMQPVGAELVYSTWTARSAKHHPGCPKTVVFGQQYTIRRWLHEYFQDNFFNVPLAQLRTEFEEMMDSTFDKAYANFSKFEQLHELGHLPIEIWGVPEGTLLPVGIPDHIIFNTDPDFAWLPQYLEDLWSANNWLPSTSATTAFYRKRLLEPYMRETVDDWETKIDHMCGDFSMRGHTSVEAAWISGLGHMLSFDRTATIGSNTIAKQYYGGEVAGLGTPSLEHSVVEQGIAYWKRVLMRGEGMPEYMRKRLDQIADQNWEINLIAEMLFILGLIHDVQPRGVMTYVADTYDYFGVLRKILPVIKDDIMERDGCFSIRPDSGNPVEIICGDKNAAPGSPEFNGTINELLDTFGSTINSKGCRVLPPQIRMIYGDAITPEITDKVGQYFCKNGISMENICFGIGAYTYQYVTRDTRGYAIKATYAEYADFGKMLLYKQPKTDRTKKSPRGCVAVIRGGDGEYCMVDGLDLESSIKFPGNIMVLKYSNGTIYNQETLSDIKERLKKDGAADANHF